MNLLATKTKNIFLKSVMTLSFHIGNSASIEITFQGTPMHCVHTNIFLPRCLTFTSLHILYSFKLSSASLDQNSALFSALTSAHHASQISALFSALTSAHHASRISVLFCWLQYHFNFNNNDQQIKSHALQSYIFKYIFLDMSSKF